MTKSLVALVALAACSSSAAAPEVTKAPPRKPTPTPAPVPVPEPPPAQRFEHDQMVRFHMHQNFDLLRAIERLLIRGKLEDAKRFAEAIGSSPDEPGHGPWATHTIAVRDRAAALARAATVEDAVRQSARLGAACAACHAELGAPMEVAKPPPVPPDKPTLEARMLRHRWAADRLWEGMVGNSDAAWREGLDVLAAAPLQEPKDRLALARSLQRQADQARRPGSGPKAERSTTYGEILVICASCHAPKK